jgi:hypothetical protein
MPNERRKARPLISPRYEDRGIFRNAVSAMPVWLLPRYGRTGRGDVIISGHYKTETNEILPMECVFAGRRAIYAQPLKDHIRQSLARLSASEAQTVPVHVNGAWRYRFDLHQDGWQDRIRQFMVAQWIYVGANGKQQIIGEPVIRPSHQRAPVGHGRAPQPTDAQR